jgi:bifunctional oligoribonuclease and PAP phosphatase NrnA
MYSEELRSRLASFLSDKKHIVIVQGDNPDGDSLSSALATEGILHNLGINTTLLCSIDVPEYLKHLEGWSRVTNQLPTVFDAWILVDCHYTRLLDNYAKDDTLNRLKSKPLIIIDHHDSESDLDYAEIDINDIDAVATGEVLYRLIELMNWGITRELGEYLASSILSDTLGLTSVALNNRPGPIHIIANLVKHGVSLSELSERRSARLKITPDIFAYKGELIRRVQFHFGGKIATLEIPHDEIKEFSMEYNPTVVLDEARNIEGLAVMIGFKSYERNGRVFRITGRIRCSNNYMIARDLAESFEDGGGHVYAAGFKVEGDNLNLEEIKQKAIQKSIELINQPTI